ncbi:hypothetical protein [Winogradskyella sediminis]|uniref:hypothetical protein n=1 Tax=Winogradskyella sediminis TaxID=1382466 RepID=UPI003AA9BAC8
MKKLNFLFAIAFFVFISCDNKKEISFEENSLPNGYSIEIPANYFKYGENNNKLVWKSDKVKFLFVEILNRKSSNLNQEIELFSSKQNSENLYKNVRFINSETFDNNEIRGVISYFKNDTKSKGLGLVTMTNYAVFAIVNTSNFQFRIESSSLSENNFDEITKSIKSISLNSKKTIDMNTTNNNSSEIIDSLDNMYRIKEQIILDKYDSINKQNIRYAKTIDSLKSIKNSESFNQNDKFTETEKNNSNKEEEKVISFLKEHYKFYDRDHVFRNPIVKKIDDYNFDVSIEECNRKFKDSDFHYNAKIIHIATQEDGSLKIGKRYYKTKDGRTRYGNTYY